MLIRLQITLLTYGFSGVTESTAKPFKLRPQRNGYRSLILFDPKLKSGVVALWNSNTSQPGGLEFEVMWLVPADHWGEAEHQAIVEPLDIAGERERFERLGLP